MRPKPDAWMPLFVGDYLRDTMHLSTVAHGAYMLLLMHYWTNGPLPDNEAMLATIARLSVEAWREIAPVVRGFFLEREDGHLHQARADRERRRARRLSSKRQEAATARWKRATEAEGEGEAEAGAEPSKQPDDAERAQLFSVGIGIVSDLTGKPAGASARLLGKLLRDLHDDCPATLELLREAAEACPADAAAWLTGAAQHRGAPKFKNGFLEAIKTEGMALRDPVSAFIEDHENVH